MPIRQATTVCVSRHNHRSIPAPTWLAPAGPTEPGSPRQHALPPVSDPTQPLPRHSSLRTASKNQWVSFPQQGVSRCTHLHPLSLPVTPSPSIAHRRRHQNHREGQYARRHCRYGVGNSSGRVKRLWETALADAAKRRPDWQQPPGRQLRDTASTQDRAVGSQPYRQVSWRRDPCLGSRPQKAPIDEPSGRISADPRRRINR